MWNANESRFVLLIWPQSIANRKSHQEPNGKNPSVTTINRRKATAKIKEKIDSLTVDNFTKSSHMEFGPFSPLLVCINNSFSCRCEWVSLRNGHRVVFCFTIYFHFFVHRTCTHAWGDSIPMSHFNAMQFTHTLSHSHSNETSFPMSQPLYNCILYRCTVVANWIWMQIYFYDFSVQLNNGSLLNSLCRNVVMFMGLCSAHFIDYFHVCVRSRVRNMQFHCRSCMKSTIIVRIIFLLLRLLFVR